MKTKSLITVVLLLFVGASIVYLVLGNRREGGVAAIATTEGSGTYSQADSLGEVKDPPERSSEETSTYIVYYFHRDFRCQACITLEALCHEAIERGFSKELNEGVLEWLAVNVDEPENEHFVDRFQLYAQSLVVERYMDGQPGDWKNLEKIWDLMDSEEAFMNYVQSEVKTFLGGS